MIQSQWRHETICRQLWMAFICIILLGSYQLAFAMHLGINLDSVKDWNPDHAFIDVFKKSRDWMTRNSDGSGSWNSGLASEIPRDANGWPTQAPFFSSRAVASQIVHTIITVSEAGAYVCRYEGRGEFSINASGLSKPLTIVADSAGVKQFTFDVALDADGQATIWLEILVTQPDDYLKNFQMITPGFQADADAMTFHPRYKENLQNFQVLRFMDWGQTNASPVVHWQDRTRPEHNTQARSSGVALEYIARLANELEKDVWICIPHMADDDYVTQAARLLRDNLTYNLKIYLEYSNETWNTAYPFGTDGLGQTDWVQDQGQRLGLDVNRWIAGHKYTALRSAQVWQLFEKKFYSTADRVIKVLGSQAANVSVSQMRINTLLDPNLNPTGLLPDALAIAPYFGNHIADQLVTENTVESISTDAILDIAADDIYMNTAAAVIEHQELAIAHGLWLITYEGGQHLAGTMGNENNDVLTDKLIAANRHPLMYDLYINYLDTLMDSGICLFNHFAYIAAPSKWGAWGSLEYLLQPIELAPKFEALADWSHENMAVNQIPHVHLPDSLQTIDQDGNGAETIALDGRSAKDLDGWIRYWTWQVDGQTVSNQSQPVLALPVGSHDISLTVTDYQGGAGADTMTVVVKPGGNGSDGIWFENPEDFVTADRVEISEWETGCGIDSIYDSDVLVAGYLNNSAALSTLAESIETGQYFSATITPEAGYQLDLRGADVMIRIRRFDNHGGHRYAVFSSIDGFENGKQIFESASFNSWRVADVDLAFMLPFDNYGAITDAIEFRVYPFEAQYLYKKSGIAAVELGGAVSLAAQ